MFRINSDDCSFQLETSDSKRTALLGRAKNVLTVTIAVVSSDLLTDSDGLDYSERDIPTCAE